MKTEHQHYSGFWFTHFIAIFIALIGAYATMAATGKLPSPVELVEKAISSDPRPPTSQNPEVGVKDVAMGQPLPSFASDEAMDRWLRARSLTYALAAKALEKDQPIKFVKPIPNLGVTFRDSTGVFCVALPESRIGFDRANLLAFLVVLAGIQSEQKEIDSIARDAVGQDANAYAERYFSFYYRTYLTQYQIVQEIEQANGGLPVAEFDFWSRNVRSSSDITVMTFDTFKVHQKPTYTYFKEIASESH